MGLFSKSKAIDLPGIRDVAAVGTSYRPQAVPKPGTRGVVRIVAEPKNRTDPHAVKVVTDLGHAGYLPKEVAREYSSVLIDAARARVIIRVSAEVREGSMGDGGGWILLQLPEVDAIRAALQR